jgi:hypothetical protein
MSCSELTQRTSSNMAMSLCMSVPSKLASDAVVLGKVGDGGGKTKLVLISFESHIGDALKLFYLCLVTFFSVNIVYKL